MVARELRGFARPKAIAAIAAIVLAASSLTGCLAGRTESATVGSVPPRPSRSTTAPRVLPAAPSISIPAPAPAPSSVASTPAPAVPSAPVISSPTSPTSATLDIGGTTILPGHRIVADYGAAGGGGLGILGVGTPDQAAADVANRASQYTAYGEPVVGAMELLATVAQASPGPSGQYTSAPNLASISSYLAAAKRAHELLVLDFQPGRASFLSQVMQVQSILLDPDVSVALDPEWKVGSTQQPGNGFIGSASAAGINAVGSYLSGLIAANDLPQKLLVIHQFALSMLPDRSAITSPPGLAVVFHADGEGSVAAKLSTYRALAFPGPPFFAGFKLFLTRDARVMAPSEVMALPRVPDLITYQ